MAYSAELTRRFDSIQFIQQEHGYFGHPQLPPFSTMFDYIDSVFSNFNAMTPNELKDSGIVENQRAQFIREVWISECPTHLSNDETMEAVLQLEEENEKPECVSLRIWIKLTNLKKGLAFLQTHDLQSLSLELILMVHTLIFDDLDSEIGGKIRTVQVKANGRMTSYAPCDKIKTRLEQLIQFVNTQMQERKHEVKHALKVSSLFFSEFLHIHPFKNGNGRTARLLMQFLLRRIMVVPFSLYLENKNAREIYLDTISSAQQFNEDSQFAVYCTMCAWRNSHCINYLLL
jgi:fido (protein-threonine AMPylation protein)